MERGSVIDAQETLLEYNKFADVYWKYWWIDWYTYTLEKL